MLSNSFNSCAVLRLSVTGASCTYHIASLVPMSLLEMQVSLLTTLKAQSLNFILQYFWSLRIVSMLP